MSKSKNIITHLLIIHASFYKNIYSLSHNCLSLDLISLGSSKIVKLMCDGIFKNVSHVKCSKPPPDVSHMNLSQGSSPCWEGE